MTAHEVRRSRPRRLDELPETVRSVCTSLLDGLETTLGGDLHAIYLYGAMVFPESNRIQDIDSHVIVGRTFDTRDRETVLALHQAIGREFPPFAGELDGCYVHSDDARRASPPEDQLHPGVRDEWWALHRAHMRAGYCIVLCGPDPREIFPEPSRSEIVSALEVEQRYVAKILSEHPDWCVLSLSRLIHTYEMRDVITSKCGAADWALERFQTWSPVGQAALRWYGGSGSEEDRRLLWSRAEDFYPFACGSIKETATE
jgi:hypothetical protein